MQSKYIITSRRALHPAYNSHSIGQIGSHHQSFTRIVICLQSFRVPDITSRTTRHVVQSHLVGALYF